MYSFLVRSLRGNKVITIKEKHPDQDPFKKYAKDGNFTFRMFCYRSISEISFLSVQ